MHWMNGLSPMTMRNERHRCRSHSSTNPASFHIHYWQNVCDTDEDEGWLSCVLATSSIRQALSVASCISPENHLQWMPHTPALLWLWNLCAFTEWKDIDNWPNIAYFSSLTRILYYCQKHAQLTLVVGCLVFVDGWPESRKSLFSLSQFDSIEIYKSVKLFAFSDNKTKTLFSARRMAEHIFSSYFKLNLCRKSLLAPMNLGAVACSC